MCSIWFVRLLIWEECYYEPASGYGSPGVSKIPYKDYNSSSVCISEGNKVHLLVNKMMVDNHVNVVGEG